MITGMRNKLPVISEKIGDNLIWHHLLYKLVLWLHKVGDNEVKYANLVLMENCFFIMRTLRGWINADKSDNRSLEKLCLYAYKEVER